MEEDDSNKEKRQLRNVRRNFVIYGIGVLLTFSSYFAALNLQSSINIKRGVGTITVGISFGSAILYCVLLTPTIVRKIGVKKTIIVSDISYMVFVAANVYAEFYTLIPAGLISSFGEASIWTSIGIYNVHYAREYCKIKTKSLDEENAYINLFSGYFFTISQSCQVFGNLISYLVLYVLNDPMSSSVGNSGNDNLTESYNQTFVAVNVTLYQNCGANDCQDPETVEREVDQYIPANPITIYVLIGIFVAMNCIAVALHSLFLPNISSRTTKKKIDKDGQVSYNTFVNEGEQNQEENNNAKEGFCEIVSTTLKDTFSHLFNRKQLLIAPLTIYNGMLIAFLYSEVTRAFSSCVLGVAMVGIHMVIFGFVDAVMCGVVGKCKTDSSRTIFFTVATLLDLCSYMYCLFWKPNLDYSWTIYLVFASIGFTDGIWQTLINVMYLEYFPNNHDIALTSWNLGIILGLSIGFGWSTFLCVSTKIYAQISVLLIGFIGYGFAEFIHRRE